MGKIGIIFTTIKLLNSSYIHTSHGFKRCNVHYTRFEKARIVGARALQIAMGAPLLIKMPKGKSDPVELALLEFEKGAIPMTVKRRGKLIKGPVV